MGIRKTGKLLSVLLTVLLLAVTCATAVYADENQYCYCIQDIGVSVTLSNEWFAIYADMPEDSPAIEGFNYSSKQEAIDAVIGEDKFAFFGSDTRTMFNISTMPCDLDRLTGASGENMELFKKTAMEKVADSYADAETINKPTFQFVKLDGMDFAKITGGYKMDGFCFYEIMYLTVEDNKTYVFCGDISSETENSSLLAALDVTMNEVMGGVSFDNLTVPETTATDTAATTAPVQKSWFKSFIGFDFPMWIIVIVLFVILFIGSSLAKKGEWHEQPLSLETSKCVQGFCAVAIILHHLSQELGGKGDIGALGMFTDIGVVFVGIFFFFSGYGLLHSFRTKENYLKGFLKKRLPTVLIPFYSCILIFVASSAIKGQKFGIWQLISYLTGWELINSHMWYIVEIVILYILFFLVFKLIKKENIALIAMGVLVAGMTVGSLLLGHGENMSCRYWFTGEWWYNTTMLFFVGMLMARFEGGFMRLAKKCYVWLLPLCAAISGVLIYFTKYALDNYSYWAEGDGYMGYTEKFICLGFQLPMVIFTTLTIVLIMMKVKFSNPILKFLGTISLELYLLHNLFLTQLSDGTIVRITGNAMYVVLTVVLSVALAAVVSGMDKYILSLIQRKRTAASVSGGRVHSIDCLRFIMAFFVVCIHLPFEGTAGQVAISFGKTAVPFFLVVCGYFLYRNDNTEFFARLKKQMLRILWLTIGANILFGIVAAAIMFMKSGNLNGFGDYFTVDALVNFLLYNMSPFTAHLWYLGSLLYALLIMMLLCKTKLHKYVMFGAPILLGIYIALSWVGSAEYFVYRNALFVTLPYIMMGCIIKRYEDKLMKIKTPILWVIAAILCVTTIVELNSYRRGTQVPFFSAEILVYVIILLALKYRNFGAGTLLEKLGSKCSLFIYIAHMIPILLITEFVPTSYGFVKFYAPITVFVVTTLVAALFHVRSLRKKKEPVEAITTKEQPVVTETTK